MNTNFAMYKELNNTTVYSIPRCREGGGSRGVGRRLGPAVYEGGWVPRCMEGGGSRGIGRRVGPAV